MIEAAKSVFLIVSALFPIVERNERTGEAAVRRDHDRARGERSLE